MAILAFCVVFCLINLIGFIGAWKKIRCFSQIYAGLYIIASATIFVSMFTNHELFSDYRTWIGLVKSLILAGICSDFSEEIPKIKNQPPTYRV